jgi:hypothetical protein
MKEVIGSVVVIVVIACLVVHVPTKEELQQERQIKQQVLIDRFDQEQAALNYARAKALSKAQ